MPPNQRNVSVDVANNMRPPPPEIKKKKKKRAVVVKLTLENECFLSRISVKQLCLHSCSAQAVGSEGGSEGAVSSQPGDPRKETLETSHFCRNTNVHVYRWRLKSTTLQCDKIRPRFGLPNTPPPSPVAGNLSSCWL